MSFVSETLPRDSDEIINCTTLTHLSILNTVFVNYGSWSIVFRLSFLIGVTTKEPDGRGDMGELFQKFDLVDKVHV